MTVFVAIQISVFATALAFCVLGAVVNRLRNRRDRQREVAHHWAATVVLDAGPDLEAAGRALADMPISVLAEVLQHLSSDTTGEARRRLQVVAQHAGLTHRIERLVHRRSWHRRVQAAHLMMLLPDEGAERVMLLDDPHPFVRARAIEGLPPAAVEEFAEILLDALGHASPAVRSAAQHALARGGASCVPHIVEYLIRVHEGRLSAEASALVVEVAAELPDPRLVEPILSFVDHDDPTIRRLVAGCLGNGIFHEPASSLAQLLSDREPEVRAAAARSVGSGALAELAPPLGRLLADSTWQVRREAGTALAHLGPMGRVVLRCHLRDDDLFARDMAIHILDQMSGLTNDAGPSFRWVAA
jgi:hypothetical protein